jgi:N-acetylmuramoyl-L-alanine amidase
VRKIDAIVVHCSDSPDVMDVGASVIRKWHTDPPRSWDDIGYHYVIRRSGEIECGRMESVVGAHAKGMNIASLGVCWVGKDKPSDEQYAALVKLVCELRRRYSVPIHRVYGHNEADPQSGKTCPNLNMIKLREACGQ